jgi:3-phytase
MSLSHLLRCLFVSVVLLLIAGCASRDVSDDDVAAAPDASEYAPEPDEEDDVTTAHSGVRFVDVAETYVSAATPDHNVDSPASWRTPDGATWVLASAKATDQVLVYDGDTGILLRSAGRSGAGPGEFSRPNGVFVIDDLLFVVERDNRRVQVLRLPELASLGSFGAQELQKPYGLWLHRSSEGYEVLVSDAYMSEQDEDAPPPLAELGRRFKRYAVRVEADALHATLLGAFGDVDTAGAIRIPESIWGDEAQARLMIAEEDQSIGTRLRVYGFDHRYAGRDVGAGLFHAQAEGLSLWRCDDGSGYWIATDQYKDRSVFHLFDRRSFEHLGAFAGRVTANTDGVWLQQAPTRAFPAGVFYAIHDDQALAAFDWRDVAKALKLRESCGR